MISEPSNVANTVTILEDSDRIANGFKEHFTRNRFHVNRIHNLEEALKALNRYDCTVPNYILDINLGQDLETEGLRVLKAIRERDEMAFVALYTAYGQYRKEAEKYGVNLFVEKKFDFFGDLEFLRIQMLTHDENIHRQHLKDISDMLNEDINEAAYRQSLKNRKWRNANLGHCVAFFKGKLVLNKRMERIDFIRLVRTLFSRQPVFIARVGQDKPIKHLRSPRIVRNR